MERDFSRVANNLYGQPMFKTLAKTQAMKDVIHFELGDPDFPTPQHITETAIDSLRKGETHYVDSMGLKDLRIVVQYTTKKTRGFAPSIDQVLVTPGANIIIYLVMQCLCNPGDEVIIPNPGFPTYFSVATMLGINIVSVPLFEKNEFRLNPKDVRNKITDKTRLIIINSPSNPTGSVMTPEEIDEIYDIAKKNDLFILSDEVYSRMIYDNKFHSPSKNDYCKSHTIVLNGFSKAFAMTGWRLGVAIGPDKLIEKMGLLVQTLCSCVPPFVQRGGIAAIMGSQEEVKEMMTKYRLRRDYIATGLDLLPGISCKKAEGGFYVFPNITQTGMTSQEFADFALKCGVALLPGIDFGNYGEGFVRLSYATDLDNIKKGLDRLYEGLRLRY